MKNKRLMNRKLFVKGVVRLLLGYFFAIKKVIKNPYLKKQDQINHKGSPLPPPFLQQTFDKRLKITKIGQEIN